MATFRRILATSAPGSTILIRLMVGAVFLSEGIQKFLDPAQRGTGRFEKIGLPEPELLGPFVGSFEVACGALILLGLLTRLAAVPLITIMVVAISTTKVPILLHEGFWQAAHDARTDWSMLLGSLFLLIQGAGPWSVDRLLGPLRSVTISGNFFAARPLTLPLRPFNIECQYYCRTSSHSARTCPGADPPDLRRWCPPQASTPCI